MVKLNNQLPSCTWGELCFDFPVCEELIEVPNLLALKGLSICFETYFPPHAVVCQGWFRFLPLTHVTLRKFFTLSLDFIYKNRYEYR